ncbi:unnamed protein product [Penicillium pancosmium]
MHEGWLIDHTPEELLANSEWRMTEAADEIPGLHHTRVFGFIFMGWNRAAVRKAVRRHLSKNRLEPWGNESEGQTRREKLHRKYLVKLNRRMENLSPIGRYIVESEHLDAEPICVGIDLVLDIHRTETPGVFKADFDLGVAVGVMIMCSDKVALDEYCARVDREDEENWHNSSDKEVSEGELIDEDGISPKKNLKLGDKRGPPASKSKKRAMIQKTGEDQALQYFLKLKYRRVGEGRIRMEESNGTIKFENEKLASCEGVVDLPIGDGGTVFCVEDF